MAATSEGFKVARPQLRDSEGLQVWASDGKDSPGGSGQTWALTPGQSEEVTEIVSGEFVQGGAGEEVWGEDAALRLQGKQEQGKRALLPTTLFSGFLSPHIPQITRKSYTESVS